jgi:threonyl-tRNA synthetase
MKNEHRKIGNELKLFNLSEYSSGMIMWYPKGYSIYQKIEDYLRKSQNSYNYLEVKSPIMANKNLWKVSGHLDNFKENMFFLNDNDLAIKPMNCPFHIDIFKQMKHSHKDLPVRLSEFGLCHRNESSGALNGLFRLRQFNQDDGHIFCKKEYIKSELISFIDMLYGIYLKFGFPSANIFVKIALRPENKIGDDELWDEAESYLIDALKELNIDFELLSGEGAFYGPKIEFGLKDSLNREWQCGVFQLDFVLAKKFNASFINEKGEEEYPVILHRAVLGSLERFIAILLEHYNGKLPLWLNPNAISIIPVSEEHMPYCEKIKEILSKNNIDCQINNNSDSFGYKIRQQFKNKGNFCFFVGDKEIENNEISIKHKKLNEVIPFDELQEFLDNI